MLSFYSISGIKINVTNENIGMNYDTSVIQSLLILTALFFKKETYQSAIHSFFGGYEAYYCIIFTRIYKANIPGYLLIPYKEFWGKKSIQQINSTNIYLSANSARH